MLASIHFLRRPIRQRQSRFGTQRITNEQFLLYYHQARKEAFSPENIESAFDPSHVLHKYRPSTSVTATSTELCAQLQLAQVQKVNELLSVLYEITATPYKSQLSSLSNIALAAIADNQSLQRLNDEMVIKQKAARGTQTKKNYRPVS